MITIDELVRLLRSPCRTDPSLNLVILDTYAQFHGTAISWSAFRSDLVLMLVDPHFSGQAPVATEYILHR